ncbi:hypothetical protein ACPPVT_07755 [Angustibacter sp. McL0619]|uniref:hypothetical protein n=1 Tax=Angustibacter sp. McL0619 TaxID=3415676 RepID=UPI003CFA37E1
MSGRDETTLELTQCPECDALAEVVARFTLGSTDGPIEHARVTCILKHGFVMPAERLVPEHLAKEPSSRPQIRVRRRRE